MKTPAEHFGLPILGRVTSPGIAGLPPKTYDVVRIIELLKPAGRSYTVNAWFNESLRQPLAVVEQFGAVFTPITHGGN
jgi:hypothetical protein